VKHQYFGDINDYRKYGLLRCIADVAGLPVGVLWFLTADDGRSDGEIRRYLREPRQWRHHDPALHDKLTKLLEPEIVRNVDHAEAWDLVPASRYFNEKITDDPEARSRYVAAAAETLAHCPLLFLDPDNGIEVKSVRYGTKNSSKYVYWRELAALYERGHSLLVYQHYPRIKRLVFEDALVAQFHRRMGACEVAVFSSAHVGFFLVLQDGHASSLPSIGAAVDKRWGEQLQFKVAVRPPADPMF
jgi:hypothetical protein